MIISRDAGSFRKYLDPRAWHRRDVVRPNPLARHERRRRNCGLRSGIFNPRSLPSPLRTFAERHCRTALFAMRFADTGSLFGERLIICWPIRPLAWIGRRAEFIATSIAFRSRYAGRFWRGLPRGDPTALAFLLI